MGIKGKKLGVKMINEVKKYKDRGLNNSEVARVLGVSRNTVKKYLKKLTEESPEESSKPFSAPWATQINWKHVLNEKSLGTQLAHYWEQHVEHQVTGVSYISFWREFKRRHPRVKLDMHQSFIPGERAEFDFKGKDKGFGFVERETGEFIPCRLFGMILPASQLFFSRATLTEKQDDVFTSITKGFENFKGVSSTLVFDNAKAQVTRADKFDADLNSEFSLLCDHYEIAPIAARPRSPKDKSLIENSLGVFWRWAWPQLRRMTFFSLREINAELERLLITFNNRVQKKYGLSRRQRFEQFEKQKLKPLPVKQYDFGSWKKSKVHPDCHIQVNHNFYSVPYKYRFQELNVRISGRTLEVFSGLERVAVHNIPLSKKGCYITDKKHLPESHQAMLEQTPQNAIKEALTVGVNTHVMVKRLIEEARHPLAYLRRVQGILRLKKRYSSVALEEASEFFKNASLKDIKVRNIEQVITAQSKVLKPKKVIRKENENLRGQINWADTFH